MVLHNIADDAKLVEVSATTLGTERLLERDLHVVDVMSVPGGSEERVAEAKDEDVLYHFLAEIMVDAEKFLLLPVRLKRLLKLS